MTRAERIARALLAITGSPCPRCGKLNTDNWPLTIGDEIKEGGCQECWEADCSDAWRDAQPAMDLLNRAIAPELYEDNA